MLNTYLTVVIRKLKQCCYRNSDSIFKETMIFIVQTFNPVHILVSEIFEKVATYENTEISEKVATYELSSRNFSTGK